MSQLIKPRNPQINWNNPITKGLVLDIPFFEKGGNQVIDLVGRGQGAFSNSPTWQMGPFGRELKFAPSSNNLVTFTSPATQNSLNVLSIEAIVFLNGNGEGNQGRFFNKGNPTRFFLGYVNSSTPVGGIPNPNNCLQFGIGRSPIFSLFDTQLDSFVPGNYYHTVVTCSSISGFATPTMIINGIQQTITIAENGSGALTADGTGLYLGSTASTVRDWDGNLVYVRMWNRLLNLQEAKQLHANPWQVYKKSSQLYFTIPSQIKTFGGVPLSGIKKIEGVDIVSVKRASGVFNSL